ncbi:MAG TPA: class II SORL domain-containing protein [Negativicutes bacterium]|nr:class II SORL domain-containing protein [Negativicutes bacterium]
MKISDLVQSADWKTEKHVPVIEAPDSVKVGEKFVVQVSVGKEIAHPNTTEHHIRSIKLFFKPEGGKFAYVIGDYAFAAHGESVEGANKGPAYSEPQVTAAVKLNGPGTLVAEAYCNIHGLWEGSKEIKVVG